MLHSARGIASAEATPAMEEVTGLREAPKLGREEVKGGKDAQEEEWDESMASGPKW